MKKDLFYILLLLLFPMLFWANPLQEAIDNAPEGATIKLPKGIYTGNILINKPLTLIGKASGAVIKGEGKGSVITITAPYVRLENLTITHSGEQMITLDAAVSMDQVSHCTITGCTIYDTLYGIDMKIVSDSNITNNTIRSYPFDVPQRGDAIKIWYSHDNLIQNNHIDQSRDVTVSFSHHIRLIGNRFEHGRFGIHLSNSHHNEILKNSFNRNAVGIMDMGAMHTFVANNQILSSRGAAGIAIVIKGGKEFILRENRISYNAKGIYIDSQAKEQGMRRYINSNIISYNKEALHFHQAIKNNTIVYNRIYGNLDDVVKDTENRLTSKNLIEYNYWDHYQGFDQNGDNIGDMPHSIYQYADQLWHYNHKVKFFYASPTMSLLNFLTNLAPFVEPHLLLEDKKPIVEMKSEK